MKCERRNCKRNARKSVPWCNLHYDAERRLRETLGGRKCGRIPAGPTVERIQKLRGLGLGNRRIAELAGVTLQTVQRLKHHPYTFVDTAHKILSIPIPATPHELAADGCKVPILGSARRLQALNATGYSNEALAGRLGVSAKVVSRWISASRFINASAARDIDALFRELQLTPAPDSFGGRRAKLRAVRSGWPPPFAWDNIDDPDALPDVGEPGNFLDFIEDARNLHLGVVRIAEIAGCSVDTLQSRIRRHEKALVA